jgi:hypothetical protein
MGNSNAQLANCLTKSMDSSSLIECLRSGRYGLFDENRVLQERSDKRQWAKWMKEATTSPEKSSAEDINHSFGLEASWEMNSQGQVVRIHNVPRRARFSPIGGPGCPVDIRNIQGWREPLLQSFHPARHGLKRTFGQGPVASQPWISHRLENNF